MSQPQRESWKESEGELFRLLVENVKDYAIFVIDPEGRVESWNPGAERLLGFREEEMIGQSIAVFFTPEDIEKGFPQREMQQALKEGRGNDDRWHVRKDGSRFWCGGTLTPLWDEDRKLRGFAKIMRDRTEWKWNQDATEEQVRLAAFIKDVGLALTQSDSLPEMLHNCAEAIVRHLNGAFARIWTLNPQGSVLELRASAGLYTHLDGPHSRVPVGQYKIGLIAQERLPHLTNESERSPHASLSSGLRLLVVDDNQDAAVSLATLLKLQGHEVRVAHSGMAALEMTKSYLPHVVFLDIGMPGMDGYEVPRRLRQQPGLENVVLAALTGWGQQEDRRRTAEAGFNHHLVKPPELKAIEGVLAELKLVAAAKE